jgi:hypothetical protein
VIPAHPLALTAKRRLDEPRQRALSRYYHAAGAGGVAVGVHTTQFAIRDPRHGLLAPVLELAAHTVSERDAATGRPTVRIAGVCGGTRQAVGEAALARGLGYQVGLLSLAALKEASEDQLISHCKTVAREIPLMGFYLQPAVGGRVLPRSFWRRFAEIPNVVAIKIAPFNRYQTLDVLRAVGEVGRAGDIALYTGNDDNIVADLLSTFCVRTSRPRDRGEPSAAASSSKRARRLTEAVELSGTRLKIVGGLLGHWACWTKRAVELLEACARWRSADRVPTSLLTLGLQITDCNAALFDAAHGFRGCIAGIHEVLRRQGLLAGTWCLDADETLSPGQAREIARVCRDYPHLNDDDFVREHLDEWLR